MPFKKGRSGNPRGRPPGALSQKTLDIKALAHTIIENPKYKDKLLARAIDGTLPPAVEVLFYHYLYGKPKESLDVKLDGTLDIARARDAIVIGADRSEEGDGE